MMGTAPTIDLNDPDFLANPYPTYATLRTESPVHEVEHLGWLVARHADVWALLHDRRVTFFGTPEEMTASEDKYIQDFLGGA